MESAELSAPRPVGERESPRREPCGSRAATERAGSDRASQALEERGYEAQCEEADEHSGGRAAVDDEIGYCRETGREIRREAECAETKRCEGESDVDQALRATGQPSERVGANGAGRKKELGFARAHRSLIARLLLPSRLMNLRCSQPESR